MKQNRHAAEIERIAHHYDDLVARHGDSSCAAQYPDSETHWRRFEILAEVGVARDAKILDFGCGTGEFRRFLVERCRYNGEYVGYDLSGSALQLARAKAPDARFEARDVLAQGIAEEFDLAFVAGVFNNAMSDNEGFMKDVLKALFARTRKALAFNALSRYVDYFDAGLYYADPEAVFRFCKEELSPCVTLRHDYLIRPQSPPYEFTVYVHRCAHEPRKKNEG